MLRFAFWALIAAGWAVFSSDQALAAGCGHCGNPCWQWVPVERTVHVPQTHFETRTVQTCAYRPETRERTVTIYRCVPYTKQVEQRYTVMVPEQQTRTVQHRVCRPVVREINQQFTVCIPYQETRQAVRRVCRWVPATVTRKVHEDHGHWESQPCKDGCASCYRVQKVWVPNIVEREVSCTVMQPKTEEVPYEYTVTEYRHETRERTVQVHDVVWETVERQVHYTVCHPEVRSRTVDMTHYRQVPKQITQKYNVMVPYTAEKKIQVPVCRMVPKTVTTRVPMCASCAASSQKRAPDSQSHESNVARRPARDEQIAHTHISRGATTSRTALVSGKNSRGKSRTAIEPAPRLMSTDPLELYGEAMNQWQLGNRTHAERLIENAVTAEVRSPIANWGQTMRRIQGRPRAWLEKARRTATLALAARDDTI